MCAVGTVYSSFWGCDELWGVGYGAKGPPLEGAVGARCENVGVPCVPSAIDPLWLRTLRSHQIDEKRLFLACSSLSSGGWFEFHGPPSTPLVTPTYPFDVEYNANQRKREKHSGAGGHVEGAHLGPASSGFGLLGTMCSGKSAAGAQQLQRIFGRHAMHRLLSVPCLLRVPVCSRGYWPSRTMCPIGYLRQRKPRFCHLPCSSGVIPCFSQVSLEPDGALGLYRGDAAYARGNSSRMSRGRGDWARLP